MQSNPLSVTKCVYYMIKWEMTSKMTMQKMIFKSEHAKMQQYRQIVATDITNNQHKYTRDMQNIVTVGDGFRMYTRHLKNHQYRVVVPNKIVEKLDLFPISCDTQHL